MFLPIRVSSYISRSDSEVDSMSARLGVLVGLTRRGVVRGSLAFACCARKASPSKEA